MRALLSVSDKTGVVAFAGELARRGWELVSTGGTAKALADAGLAVTGISDITKFPEMMDGRVKTLHPAVHGGILARRDRASDLDAIGRHGISPIDLVAVNLYPFQETAKKRDVAFDELIENIDIGGPSMVRSAAKNFRDVLVVVSPGDYDPVLQQLSRPDGPSLDFRYQLMRKAFMHTAFYDSAIAAAFMRIDAPGGTIAESIKSHHHPEPTPLRYGENPHQKAAWIERPDAGKWRVHQGKELSYTNLLDLDAAMRIVLEFTEPAAAVIKHTNPCGAATGASISDAYVAARDADALSAFGGIVGLNRPIDEATASALVSTFIEAVIAPAIADGAQEILAGKANMRVLTADFDYARVGPYGASDEVRSILGGVLTQEADRVDEAREPWPPSPKASASGAGEAFPKVVTKRQPTADEWEALRFAWRVCAHVKSNAVIFTTRDRTIAVGAGQMSRVDAVHVAMRKASQDSGGGHSLSASVAASDAFFPFRDGLDAVAAAGATAVVQPGGSKRDDEVIAAADEHGIAMIFTGRRHFRH